MKTTAAPEVIDLTTATNSADTVASLYLPEDFDVSEEPVLNSAVTVAHLYDGTLASSHLHAVVSIAALNGLDIATTAVALRLGHIEANPLAKLLIDWHLLWPSKVILPALTVLAVVFADRIRAWQHGSRLRAWWLVHRPGWLWKLPDLTRLSANNAAWFVAGVYSLVVVLNTITVLT